MLLAVVEPLDVLERVLEDGPDGHRRALHAALGDLEDQSLGVVEQLVDRLARLVALPDDLRRDADQLAQDGLLADDAPVGQEMGGGRGLFHQPRQGRGAADLFELGAPPQLLRHREQVHRLIALEEPDHRVEDLAMTLLVEVGRLQELDRLGQALALEQDGARARRARLPGYGVGSWRSEDR